MYWNKSAEAPLDVPLIPDNSGATSSPIVNPGDESPYMLPQGETVILVGEGVCLPHRNTSGPQTLECAFGLRTDDGKHYGVDLRPTGGFDFPTGGRVRLEGILRPVEDSKYAIDSTIAVTKVERIN